MPSTVVDFSKPRLATRLCFAAAGFGVGPVVATPRLKGDSMGIYQSSSRTPANSPKAIVFDMDGVLIDSEPLHECTKRQALRSAGIEVDETVFSHYIGRSDRVMITQLARINGRSNDEIEAILAEKDRLYALGEGDLRPVPGAVDFVCWAYEEYRLAVATSATARNRKCALASLGIDLALRSCRRQRFDRAAQTVTGSFRKGDHAVGNCTVRMLDHRGRRQRCNCSKNSPLLYRRIDHEFRRAGSASRGSRCRRRSIQ